MCTIYITFKDELKISIDCVSFHISHLGDIEIFCNSEYYIFNMSEIKQIRIKEKKCLKD